MKNPKKIILMILLTVLVIGSPVQAQQSEPGLVDFDALAGALGKTPEVNINFGSAMLLVFAEALVERDAELAEMLRGISGLRLMVFAGIEGARAKAFSAETGRRLLAAGWEPALEVRDEDGTRVDFLMRASENRIRGLVLMVAEPDGSAVYANMVGDLDPVMIGRLISGRGINLSSLGDLAEQFGGSR